MFNAYFFLKFVAVSAGIMALSACNSNPAADSAASSPAEPQETYLHLNPPPTAEISDPDSLKIVAGQTVYVPVYSHIYYMNSRRIYNLATTLSVRNTDPNRSIIIKTVNYYNTEGELVEPYLEKAVRLPPLASTDFFVQQSNSKGGSGANFIVEWVAEETVAEPIVEAVSIGTSGTQGIAFTSPGRAIKNLPK